MADLGRSTSTQSARRIDPAGLTGAWVNTESTPRGVARILIERRPDALRIGALGADAETHERWGWADAEALYAASASGADAVAFTAAYAVESTPVVLHANVSKGLLIVSSFLTRFDSGNSDARFAREFFHKANSDLLKQLETPPRQTLARAVPPSCSASPFVGIWQNTNSEGYGIVSVSVAATEDGATMHIIQRDDSGLHDWGTTSVEIYSEVGAASEPAKIKARYDIGLMDVFLHGWVKQGVLVLALFRRFKDESVGSNYFDREFFYRTDDSLQGVG